MRVQTRLKVAGNQLRHANIGNALKALTASPGIVRSLEANTYNRSSAGFWMFGTDGSDTHFTYNDIHSPYKAYTHCSPVFSVVNRKAQDFINGHTKVVNSKGKEANSEAAKKVKTLLLKPNPIQSGSEFKAQGYIHRQLFGYNIIYINKSVGFENYNANSIWNVPPNMVDIEESEQNFLTAKSNEGISKITLKYKGARIPLDVKNIFIIKDFAPSFDSVYLPQSRIKALEMQVNNIIGAYKSRNVLINKRGALGMITPEKEDASGTVALTSKEKEDLQREYAMKNGLMDNQTHVIISSAAVKWQSMGYPTKELMLFEEIEDDIMRICDAYGYPYPLLSSNRTNSLGGNNIDASIKYLYQGTIIPESKSWDEQMNDLFQLNADVKIQSSYEHIPALQEDKAKQASAELIITQAKKIQFDAGLITLNQFLEGLGYEAIGESGNVRSNDTSNTNVPLATLLGVGGIQSLIGVLTATGLSDEARASTLQILFGISNTDAAAMTATTEPAAETETPLLNNEQ